MLTVPFHLMLVLSASGLLSLQGKPAAEKRPPQGHGTPDRAAELRAFKAELTFLTSEAAAGRDAGSAGSARVIEHLARRLEEIGLQPFTRLVAASGTKGSLRGYQQPFTARRGRRDFVAEGTGLGVWDGRVFRELEVRRDLVPCGGSSDGEVEAELVFAGYGLGADYQVLAARGVRVRGRVVLVLRGVPRLAASVARPRRGTLGDRRRVWFAHKLAAARAAGAVGILFCLPPDPRVWGGSLSGALRVEGEARMPAFWISRAAARRLLGEAYAKAGALAATPRADEDLRGLVVGSRVRLRARMGPRVPRLRTANVLGVLPGRDPSLASELLVVGAHHDHLGHGSFGSMGGPAAVGKLHPGADDNASGVAALLILAARMVREPPPRRTVIFAFFGAEELDLQGSRAFLRLWPEDAGRVVAMLNLSMLGRMGRGLTVSGIGSSPGFAKLESLRTPGRVRTPALRHWSGCRSDHVSFLARGIPALLFTTGFSREWHTPRDVACLVDVGGALDIVDVVQGVVEELAARASLPAFRKDGWRRHRRPR